VSVGRLSQRPGVLLPFHQEQSCLSRTVDLQIIWNNGLTQSAG
jgi:hypothetical protein